MRHNIQAQRDLKHVYVTCVFSEFGNDHSHNANACLSNYYSRYNNIERN